MADYSIENEIITINQKVEYSKDFIDSNIGLDNKI